MHYQVNTYYDEVAYKALSDASWQLFQGPKMRTLAYPMIIMMALLTLFATIVYRQEFGIIGIVLGVALILFSISAIPLSKINGKKKLFRASIKEATKAGEFPINVQLSFLNKGMKSRIKDHSSSLIPYSEVVVTALLDEWCFIYFDKGAYMVNQSAFSTSREYEGFKDFLIEKTQMELVQL